MEIDICQIQKILPHRYPFLLIDRIIDFEENKNITAIKNVTFNEVFFQGHFPEKPVMPGVLVIEALAQTGAYGVLQSKENLGKIALLTGIRNAKFRKSVVPGDTLILYVELIKIRKTAGIAHGLAKVNNEVVCEAEIMFFIGS